MELDKFLSIAGFAIGVSGLIHLLLRDRKKQISFVIVFSILVFIGFFAFFRTYQHQLAVKLIADEIIKNLGSEAKSFDQLYQGVYFYDDPGILKQGLDNLIREGKIGEKIIEVHGDKGEKFLLRVYYLKIAAIPGRTKD